MSRINIKTIATVTILVVVQIGMCNCNYLPCYSKQCGSGTPKVFASFEEKESFINKELKVNCSLSGSQAYNLGVALLNEVTEKSQVKKITDFLLSKISNFSAYRYKHKDLEKQFPLLLEAVPEFGTYWQFKLKKCDTHESVKNFLEKSEKSFPDFITLMHSVDLSSGISASDFQKVMMEVAGLDEYKYKNDIRVFRELLDNFTLFTRELAELQEDGALSLIMIYQDTMYTLLN